MSTQASRRERRWWTKNEDEILRNWAQGQIEIHGAVKNWNEAAALLPDRTNKDCRKRWHKVRVDIKRGAWTPEEDRKLEEAVGQAGLKWSAVSKIMQTRNADQCAKRWQHVLGPDHKHDPWTPEEDQILEAAVSKYGNNWKQIGLLELPDRSTHDIRNRSVGLNRRKRRSETSPNRRRQRPRRNSNRYHSEESGDADSSSDEDSDMFSDAEVSQAPQISPVAGPSFTNNDMAIDASGAPQTPGLSETLADVSIFSDWDIGDPASLGLVHPTDPHPWLWFGSPSASSPVPQPDRDFSSSIVPPDTSHHFNLQDQNLAENIHGRSEGQGQLSQGGNAGSVVSPSQPPASVRAHATVEGPGNVTVVLRQDDWNLAQQVIENLMKLNADLTIRLVKD